MAKACSSSKANTVRGVMVEPSTAAQSEDPGTTVTYTLRVTNTGNTADTFDVAVSGNSGTTDAPTTVGPLAANAGADVEVTVDVPAGAGGGDSDTTTVTVTSQNDGARSDSSTLTTTANTVCYMVYLPVILKR